MTRKKAADLTVEESWPKMVEETRLLKNIHPYPNNPRSHPPAQIAMLAAMIKRHGPDQRIVIDADDDFILKGHGRREAAMLAGLKEFPVLIRHGLSDADKKAMRIEDNQVALLSGWNPELIRAEIISLKGMDYDVSLLGFGAAQLVQFTTTPGPPSQFSEVGENLPTSYCCPRCAFEWSGAPKPPPIKQKKAPAKRASKKQQQ